LTARIVCSFDWPMWRALGGLEAMNGERLRALRNSMAAAKLFAVIAANFALLCSSPNAVQPPSDPCRVPSKFEYDSARKQFLLRTRFGTYVRTGRIWHRHYWYCQL